jgi:molybdopterin molybdotransferase
MPAPIAVNPLEALAAVTGKIKQGTVERIDLESAAGRYLAEPLQGAPRSAGQPADPPGILRSSCNGYALPGGCGAGDRLSIREGLADLIADGGRQIPSGCAIRVETGAFLPNKTWGILPVEDGTLLGTGKLRIERLPQAGEGILGLDDGKPAVFEAGTLLSTRHQAYLLAAGVEQVCVHSPPRVGMLLLGDELTDLKTGLEAGQVHDLNGYWLRDAIEDLGLEVIPLGISEDGPAGLQKHLVRCHTRQLDVLILSGGTGSGITDRTAEAIQELNGHVLFEKLSLHGCDSLVFGKLNNMDVLGLSGRPLSCSAGFDLFCRPLLLARSGASKGYWNWASMTYPDEILTPPPHLDHQPENWCLQVGKLSDHSTEGLIQTTVKTWNPETLFSPVAAGSEGWVLRPPGPEGKPVFFSRQQ